MSTVKENMPSELNESVIDEKASITQVNDATTTEKSSSQLMTEIEILLKDPSALEQAVELYGTFMEKKITELDGNGSAPELAEDYARYGSLLLRLAIQNNDQNVLGSSAAGAGIAGGEEATAALLMAADSNKKQKLIEFNGDESEEEEQDDEDEEDTPANAAFDDEIAAAQEEDDDFTIAWENLDVARLLFEKRLQLASPEEQPQLLLKLARVYQDLGDLCLEDENFEQAISDYQEALKAFAQSEQDHLRDIAGIYFNLALCQEFCSRLPEATEMYTQAKTLLERKRDTLTSASSDEKESESGEVAELEGLIGEIGAKLEDLASGKSSIGEAQAEGLEQMRSAALQAAQSLSGSINDLSGMIKKRKAE